MEPVSDIPAGRYSPAPSVAARPWLAWVVAIVSFVIPWHGWTQSLLGRERLASYITALWVFIFLVAATIALDMVRFGAIGLLDVLAKSGTELLVWLGIPLLHLMSAAMAIADVRKWHQTIRTP